MPGLVPGCAKVRIWGASKGREAIRPRGDEVDPSPRRSGGLPGSGFWRSPWQPCGSTQQHRAAAGARGQSGDTRPGRRRWLLLVSEGCQPQNQERVLTIRCRLEVDLQVRQEGEEPLRHPKPVFFATTFSPTSLAVGGGGRPGCRLVPLVSRRSQRPEDWRSALPHKGFGGHQGTRYMQRSGRDCVSVGLSCPRSHLGLVAGRTPPEPGSCDTSHLAELGRGQIYLSKGYGVNS